MHIFLAGATGVIGMRMIPALLEMGHSVTGMTRSSKKVNMLSELGAEPVLCDVYDLDDIQRLIADCGPEMIISQLTDLPDDLREMPSFSNRNNMMRTVGIQNLLCAAKEAGSPRLLVQSVAWELPRTGSDAVRHVERSVLDYGGTVLRYGRFYGPGTFYENEKPPSPRVSVERAAKKTIDYLNTPRKIIEIADED